LEELFRYSCDEFVACAKWSPLSAGMALLVQEPSGARRLELVNSEGERTRVFGASDDILEFCWDSDGRGIAYVTEVPPRFNTEADAFAIIDSLRYKIDGSHGLKARNANLRYWDLDGDEWHTIREFDYGCSN